MFASVTLIVRFIFLYVRFVVSLLVALLRGARQNLTSFFAPGDMIL